MYVTWQLDSVLKPPADLSDFQAHTRNTKVGDDFVRGVSGGERKRVSIAEMALAGETGSSFIAYWHVDRVARTSHCCLG